MHFSNKVLVVLKIIRSKQNLKDSIFKIREKKQSIGFVPTMGSLHEGHVALLKQSIQDNDITICSIYVNPTQFNDAQDFSSYPRNEKKDIESLKKYNCSILFLPEDGEMYPNNINSIQYESIKCMNLLEGEKRPGHFDGVIKIVHRLFNLIKPNRAYFGEKDYQQLWIISRFIKKSKFNIEIQPCPTMRDKYGLALSSRNKKLNKEEKNIAPMIFQELTFFKNKLESIKSMGGEISHQRLSIFKDQLINNFTKKSLIKLDYFEVIDNENFRFASEIKITKSYRALIAVYVGNTRLIDNILID